MKPPQEFASSIAELLHNAEENGYPVWDWDIDDIAADLRQTDDELLALPLLEVRQAVQEVLDAHGNPQRVDRE